MAFSLRVGGRIGWVAGCVMATMATLSTTAALAQGRDKSRPREAPRVAQAPAAPAAEGKKRAAEDRQIVTSVLAILKRDHLTKHELDDEISERAMKLFIKSLDPAKVYFYQSDIDEFDKNKRELDDMVGKKRDVSFGYVVFARWMQRIEERVTMVDEILKQPVDFSIEETAVTNGDALDWCKSPEEAKERWRKRVKWEMLTFKSDKTNKLEGDALTQRISRRYHTLLRNAKQTEPDEQMEMFLTSVTSSYDPHTTYMGPSTLKDFKIQMQLELDGIGAALQSVDGVTEVQKIVPGGAADKQGELKEKDRIVSVGQGVDGEMLDVAEMKLKHIVAKIRGKAGTIVRLGVVSADSPAVKIVTIERAKIELKDSEARGEVVEIDRPDGRKAKIGVIDLPSFYMDMDGARAGIKDYKSTSRDCEKLLQGFKKEGVECVILDLRRNGGGSLDESIKLTGLFIDQGPVVQVKDSVGDTKVYNDPGPGLTWDKPLVVLTSRLSASASEIFAGAIQDYRRGLVVGDSSTHGKGTVQSLTELAERIIFGFKEPPNLGALKITQQQFYRPSGDSTQKRGVYSDVVLPSITDHLDMSETDLDYALEFDKVDEAPHDRYDQAGQQLLTTLKDKSKARIEASADFQKLEKNIEKFVEQKKKKEVQLNEKAFLEQRDDVDADREQEKIAEDQDKARDQVVKRDFYFNEVLEIAGDYLDSLGRGKVAKVD